MFGVFVILMSRLFFSIIFPVIFCIKEPLTFVFYFRGWLSH